MYRHKSYYIIIHYTPKSPRDFDVIRLAGSSTIPISGTYINNICSHPRGRSSHPDEEVKKKKKNESITHRAYVTAKVYIDGEGNEGDTFPFDLYFVWFLLCFHTSLHK